MPGYCSDVRGGLALGQDVPLLPLLDDGFIAALGSTLSPDPAASAAFAEQPSKTAAATGAAAAASAAFLPGLEVFLSEEVGGRGLRLSQEAAEPIPAGTALLAESPVPRGGAGGLSDFAALSVSEWPALSQVERRRLLNLTWRSSAPSSSSSSSLLGSLPCPLAQWGQEEEDEEEEEKGSVSRRDDDRRSLSRSSASNGSADNGNSNNSSSCNSSNRHNDPTLKAPPLPRLRGIAALNGMACGTLRPKPSLIKSFEAEADGLLGVFPCASLMNHSCMPSALRFPTSTGLLVRSCRQISPGEEITCSYVEVRAPLSKRRAELEEGWGFTCGCDRCRFEASIADLLPASLRQRSSSKWRAFERLRSEGACSEEELRNIVQSLEESAMETMRVLLGEARVAANGDDPGPLSRSDVKMALSRQPLWKRYGEAWEVSSADFEHWAAGTSDHHNNNSNNSNNSNNNNDDDDDDEGRFLGLEKLKRLLLTSHWLAPAWELAFGLHSCRKEKEAAALWRRIRDVSSEVSPFSTSHCSAALEAACCTFEDEARAPFSAEALHDLKVSLLIAARCFGAASSREAAVALWRRLTASRTEAMATPLRRALLTELETVDLDWSASLLPIEQAATASPPKTSTSSIGGGCSSSSGCIEVGKSMREEKGGGGGGGGGEQEGGTTCVDTRGQGEQVKPASVDSSLDSMD